MTWFYLSGNPSYHGNKRGVTSAKFDVTSKQFGGNSAANRQSVSVSGKLYFSLLFIHSVFGVILYTNLPCECDREKYNYLLYKYPFKVEWSLQRDAMSSLLMREILLCFGYINRFLN